MQTLHFSKYQGAGNDFILVDQRERCLLKATDEAQIAWLCDRHFGIGADGLILLEPNSEADFQMSYFNADGRPGSLCGNGGRCVVAFARDLGVIGDHCRFLAYDGIHEAMIRPSGWVALQLREMSNIEKHGQDYCLDTGSPHFVRFVAHLEGFQVREAGRAVRYSAPFREKGINVNFVERGEGQLRVATYERGVEDETLACGTGVTAAAMAYVASLQDAEGQWNIPVETKGGKLEVQFRYDGATFSSVWLCGPAQQVFTGRIALLQQ